MEIFFSTLQQMLMMFTFILLGFLFRKKNWLPENSGTVMAKMETFLFVPALSLFTQMTKCTVQTFTENANLIFYGFVLVMGAIILAYPLSRLFVRKGNQSPEQSYQREIFKYALTFGNYGFMGNFIILGVWGNDFFYQYSLFTLLLGIVCQSWGLYILIPKEQSAGLLKNLQKGLLTPPVLALVIGIILGLTGLSRFCPDFLLTVFDNAGKCQGPVAMLLAGFIIGGYDLKELFLNKKVYAVTGMRLFLIPGVMMLIMKALGISEEIMTLALIAFATPLGLNTIVFPAAYGGDTKTGASMAMISHTLSVLTIPLMYLIFIVLL